MYTTLETPGSVPSYPGLGPGLGPPSPSKYYPAPGPAPPYSPGYQYAPYTRSAPAPGYSSDVLSGLYPGYPGQFSYEALGQHPTSLYDTSTMGKGLSNYGGIYVPSAAAASATALPSRCSNVAVVIVMTILSQITACTRWRTSQCPRPPRPA